MHFGGPTDEGWLSCSVWRDREFADRMLAGQLGAGLAMMAQKRVERNLPASDITYAVSPIYALTTGGAARRAVGRRVGDSQGAIAYSITIGKPDGTAYRQVLENLKFTTDPPDTLIGHIAVPWNDQWRMIFVWENEQAALDYHRYSESTFESAGLDPALLDQMRIARVPLHSIVINERELAKLPRFEAPEDQWRSLAEKQDHRRLQLDVSH
jgi:hypothetical protein